MSTIEQLISDDTAPISEDHDRLVAAISFIIKAYYGINTDTIDTELLIVYKQEFLRCHSTMTFRELNLSYSDCVIEKRQGVSLTVGEIMQPAALFWQKKALVESELKLMLRENDDKAKKEVDRMAFRREAEQVYFDSLAKGEWIGTMFHAKVLAPDYSSYFESQKEALWREAQDECREAKAKQQEEIRSGSKDMLTVLPVPMPEYFYADKIMQLAVQSKIKNVKE